MAPPDRRAAAAMESLIGVGPAGYRSYYYLVLFVLTFTTLSIDRSIVSVMLEPIKAEFRLSDAALGFMNGIAFAICFGLAGIPLGRLADRFSRRTVLAPCVAFFALMTTLSGAARTFGQLVTARFLVGAGEAGGQPAMVSMLTDLFPGRQRAFAMSVYYLAVPSSSLVIYLVGTKLVAHLGWRTAFFLAGVPGLIVGTLIWFTLREPIRSTSDGVVAVPAEPPSWLQAVAYLRAQPALMHILAAGALWSMALSGVSGWIVSFFIRTHHISLLDAGSLLAASYVAPSAIGTLAGGAAADALARRGEGWRGLMPGLALIAAYPAVILVLLTPSLTAAGIFLAVWSCLGSVPFGSVLAMGQSLAAPRLRGLFTAVYYSLTYTVGVGVGPQLVGLLSDGFKPIAGADSLRWAMAIVGATIAWAGVHLVLTARTLANDLEHAQRDQSPPLQIIAEGTVPSRNN